MSLMSSTFIKLFITSLAVGAIAAPNPRPDYPSDPVQPAPGPNPSSQCVSKVDGPSTQWGVYVSNNLMPSPTDQWAGSLLDALRADTICGNIEDWQCQPDKATGVGCVFNTTTACGDNDVSNSINKAGGGWVNCQGSKMSNLVDKDGSLYTEYNGIIPVGLTDLLSPFSN